MKTLKKLMVLVLAIAMVLGTTIATSFAATVTVKQNNTTGTAGAETYKLYKIFDATKTADFVEPATTAGGEGTQEGVSYTILSSNPWFAKLGTVTDGVWAAAQGQTWVTLTKVAGSDTKYNVKWNGANTEAAAKAFAEWLESKKGDIAPDKTMTSSNKEATETVDDGYYLIESSLGTSLILATSNIVIETKNQYPSSTKTVAKTNYSVGDFVKYTIDVNVPATVDYTKPVIVHDTMDNVLSLVTATTGANAWSAKVGDTDFTSHVTLATGKANNHDSSTHAVGTNQVGYDFTLDISSLAPAAGTEATAKTVVIEYYAEITSAAAADHGYINKEFVEYSKYTTEPTPDVTVKTYDFQLKKQFAGKVNADLEATFELADSQGNTIQFIKDNTGYVKKDSDDTGASATLTVKGDATGINVRGLAAGTYTLTEKTTAEGFNLLTTPITVTIDANGNATVQQSEIFSAADGVITVNNQTGTELPSTGGMGTTILYIMGGALVVVCGIMLVAKKRTSNK